MVRGEQDFVFDGTCFRSNVVPNDGGSGEDVTKTTVFEDVVPILERDAGTVTFGRSDYGCNDTVRVTVRDTNVANDTLSVSLSTLSNDFESVTVMRSGPNSNQFSGTINTGAQPVARNDGTLQVMGAELITATYVDRDDGAGDLATSTATANVDCQPPIITDVAVTNTGGSFALIEFLTDEPATGVVLYGLECISAFDTSSGNLTTEHAVVLRDLDPTTDYAFFVEATDAAGNVGIALNQGTCFEFSTTERTEYFTETFAPVLPFDLANTQLTFTPTGNDRHYNVCVQDAGDSFPVPADKGTGLPLADDDAEEIALSEGATVALFGMEFDSFFVGSNGYLTFDIPDNEFRQSVAVHFAQIRLSGVFVDLNPTTGGQVVVSELDDRVAITYDGISEFDVDNANNFQIELFYSGLIRITYLVVEATDGIVGLSEGMGVPSDFEPTNFDTVGSCRDLDSDGDRLSDSDELNVHGTNPLDPDSDGDDLPDGWEVATGLDPLDNTGVNGRDGDGDEDNLSNIDEFNAGTLPGVADSDGDGTDDGQEVADGSDPVDMDRRHSLDTSGDWNIGLTELLRAVQFFNVGNFHCLEGTEDGFAPGVNETRQDCRPHSGDFMEQNWSFELAEMLRMIQLFNSPGYERNLLGEDGYLPLM